jgi:hypothetical protein
MDERDPAMLYRPLSDVEGASSPGVVKDEPYSVWYENAQDVGPELIVRP